MIKIIAKVNVKEDCIEKFQNGAKEIVEKSRAEEGNISYSLNQNIKKPGEHVFIEEWKDEEAIKVHNETEHFTTIFPELLTMTVGEPEIELYKEV